MARRQTRPLALRELRPLHAEGSLSRVRATGRRDEEPSGGKTELIQSAIRTFAAEFTLADLERVCPGVSRDMVRRVLKDLQRSGKLECLGRGPGAPWRKKDLTSKRR